MQYSRTAMAKGLIVGILLVALAGGCHSRSAARVVRRFHATEASQGVAVDAHFFYAIDDAAIGKYEKATGRHVSSWAAQPADAITHLDSGVVIGRELLCANSNYPATPMVSSIEVFDPDRMVHLRSIPLPSGLGSATWVDYSEGSWWVTFANYSGKGGEAGKGSAATRLVRLDPDWHPRQLWAFPRAVVGRWGTMSSSGGTAAAGRVFYTTGHDAPEIYVVEVPAEGNELKLRAIIKMESEGQGIALDRDQGLLYSIQRRTREVIVSTLPDLISKPSS
jgi:hypothetical protein